MKSTSPSTPRISAIQRLAAGLAPALVLLATASSAVAAPRLYISNEESGDVAVLDTASLRVVARISVGKRPRGIKLSPDGRKL
jgi:YVTN family beta-propeller protein